MRHSSAYLKMRALGAIEFAPGRSIRDRIKAVSAMTFEDEDGIPRRFTWRTISTWAYRYKVDGITSMKPKPRSDKGKPRKVEVEHLLEAIEKVLPSFHGKRYRISHIYRVCIERGFLRREQVAPNTFRRLVNEYELLKPSTEVENKRRLAFSKQYPNEMWQADTMFGPFVKNGGTGSSGPTATQSKLICFIDDCSRVICHGEFFFSDTTETLIHALRSALYKRGIPQMLYVDNGSNYASQEMVMIAARIGCLLCHTPVRDGAAKGKIERFFRTVREEFLSRTLDLSSLESLNQAFTTWVEDDYNSRTHSVLGMRPIDRFGMDLSRIKFLPPNEANDELFFLEQERHVLNDNTFSLNKIRFEAPRDLRDRKVQVRYSRKNFERRAIVYYKGDRMGEARPVDFVANDRKPISKGENS